MSACSVKRQARWTLNRAFRKDASISAESLRKVLEAASHPGYTPDLTAASLASVRSNLESLLIDNFSNPHKLFMMECLTRTLRHNGWGTLLVNTLDENDTALALINARQHRVDAAVLIGSKFSESIYLICKKTFLKWWQEVRGERPAFTVVERYDPQMAYRKVTSYLSGLNRTEWPDILVCENDALAMGDVWQRFLLVDVERKMI